MSNRYTSTRERSRSFRFEEALSLGYAPDGGLFVPEKLPVVDEVALKEWSYLTYPELSAAVLRLFISTEELSDPALAGICASTFEGFEDRDHAVPIVQLGSVYVAELFHGHSGARQLGDKGITVTFEALADDSVDVVFNILRLDDSSDFRKFGKDQFSVDQAIQSCFP